MGIFILSVMLVIGGVSLLVLCVFLHVDVECWCWDVHTVAILSAVLCVICSLLMFVSDVSGDHIVKAYSIMGLVMALYVASIVFLLFFPCDVGVE